MGGAIDGRRTIVVFAAFATIAATLMDAVASGGRPATVVAANTALTVVSAALLCPVVTGRGRRAAAGLTAAALGIVLLAPDAARGVPLMLTAALALRLTWSYGVRLAVAVTACTLAAWVVELVLRHPDRTIGLGPDQHPFSVALVALVVFGSLIGLANAARSEAAARERLAEAHAELARWARSAEELAALRERARIASDLHDAIGHALTATAIQVQSAARLRTRDPAAAERFLGLAEESLADALGELRATVSALRAEPPPLGVALDRLAETFSVAETLRVERRIEPAAVAPAVATVLLRVAQEALTNVVRHARARTVTLSLAPDGGEHVALTIEDDGTGFERAAASAGHGLDIMAERVASVGGRLKISSRQDAGGARIDVVVPRGVPS